MVEIFLALALTILWAAVAIMGVDYINSKYADVNDEWYELSPLLKFVAYVSCPILIVIASTLKK